MMTLCILWLSYSVGIFPKTIASEFKEKFLPIATYTNGATLIRDVNERYNQMKKIETVLQEPSSFMAVAETEDYEKKAYFFFTEPSQRLQRLDAYIIYGKKDLTNFENWHRKYFPNYILYLF